MVFRCYRCLKTFRNILQLKTHKRRKLKKVRSRKKTKKKSKIFKEKQLFKKIKTAFLKDLYKKKIPVCFTEVPPSAIARKENFSSKRKISRKPEKEPQKKRKLSTQKKTKDGKQSSCLNDSKTKRIKLNTQNDVSSDVPLKVCPVKEMRNLNKKQLIEQLKLVCRKQGDKFVEFYPQRSAHVFRYLAKIFQNQSPDKIAIVKSCGLLNAAISRQPSDVFVIKQDLENLCKDVLLTAQNELKQQSVDTDANLIKKAEEIKVKFLTLRQETGKLLKNVSRVPDDADCAFLNILKRKKIDSILDIQLEIAEEYTKVMTNLGNYCETVLGTPPCKYAVVGMGSLARCEITPFSDFEHVIVMEDEVDSIRCLEYFRWFTVIFHFVILNLQETIIPNLYISGLNTPLSQQGDWFYDAYSTNGISFDSMMPHSSKFPLGKQEKTKSKPFTTELIKPLSMMLEYLSSESDLKCGYHLSDILTRICFVCGDEHLFRSFKKGVRLHDIDVSPGKTFLEKKRLLKSDVEKFFIRSNLMLLKSSKTINFKFLTYRSVTLFLSVLDRNLENKNFSCFETIKTLTKLNYFTEKMEPKLMFVVAIACEVRLKLYMKSKCQKDCKPNVNNKAIERLKSLIGAPNVVNFFQIIYCLQVFAVRRYNFSIPQYSHPQLLNFIICHALEEHELIESMFDLMKKEKFINTRAKTFDFAEWLDLLEKHMQKANQNIKLKSVSAVNVDTQEKNMQSFFVLGKHLHKENCFKEAVEILSIYAYDNAYVFKNKLQIEQFVDAFETICFCLLKIKQNEAESKFMRIPFDYSVKNPSSKEFEVRTLTSLYNALAIYHYLLEQYSKSLEYFEKVASTHWFSGVSERRSLHYASSVRSIGLCLFLSEKYDQALVHFKQSLEVYMSISTDVDYDPKVAVLYSDVAVCLIKLHKRDDSLIYINLLLKTCHSLGSTFTGIDLEVANIINQTGLFFMELECFKEAAKCFEVCLPFYESLNQKCLVVYAKCKLAICYQNLDYPYIEVNLSVPRIGEIYDKSSIFVADTKKTLGFGYAHDSTKFFEESMRIYEERSVFENRDNEIACLHHCLGLGFLVSKLSLSPSSSSLPKDINKTILDHLKESEKHFPEPPALQHHIGLFHMYTNNLVDSLKHFKCSLEIYCNTLADLETNQDVAFLLYSIAECLLLLKEHNEATMFVNKSLLIYFQIPYHKLNVHFLRIFLSLSDDLLGFSLKTQSLCCIIKCLDICHKILLANKVSENIKFLKNELFKGVFDKAVAAKTFYLYENVPQKFEPLIQLNENKTLDGNKSNVENANKLFSLRQILYQIVSKEMKFDPFFQDIKPFIEGF